MPVSETRLRFLHKNYSRTGRWGWRLARRIRSFGWGLALFSTIAAVLGTNVEDSAVYMIFCFAVCALVASLLWIFCRHARVSGRRSLPEFGSVGQELTYTVELVNEHHRPLSAMTFEEWPPDPTPDFETFAYTPEPGEEKRNIVDRTMLYYRWTWLQERERGFELLQASQSPRKLEPGGSGRATFHLTPQHRGLLQLGELRVLLPDPFGLFQRCQAVEARQDHIIILPKRYPLENFSLPGVAHLHLGGEAASNRMGQNGDFLHLRDYQSGDALRAVDWKSWARTGAPVVREYEDSFFPHYGILLDTSGPPGQGLEEAISVASSFVAGMDTNECLLDLMFIGDKSYRVTEGQGVARRSQLLETLATVQARKSLDFEKLRSLVTREGADLTGLLLIFPDWSPARHDFFTALQAQGLSLSALVIANEETEAAFRKRPAAQVHLLRLDQVAHDLAQAAANLQRS